MSPLNTQRIIWSLGAIFCIGLLVYFLYSSSLVGLFSPVKLTTLEYVRENNPSFVQGNEALGKGDFLQAAAKFEEALEDAQDTKQEAYIKSFLGYSKGLAGDYAGGIEVLKSVADNESYADTHRAYAMGLMGELYYRSAKDQKVADLIFSTAPYNAFRKGSDTDGAFRNLYAYANSLFPTGSANYRLAWLDSYENASSTAENLKQGIEALTDEINLLASIRAEDGYVADKFLRLANLQSLQALRGEGSPAEAERSFREALSRVQAGGNQYISISYYHALFLSQEFGKTRQQDIARLLAPFFDPAYKNTSFYLFFLDKNNQADLRVLKNVQRIAAVDSQFGSLMQSLGWKL